ncbi:aminobenzoyl-glutamate utilization protein B [Tetragenococcus halophilus subsp. flandriensis]|uniref:amidohydrolase n=1 Tax=Tetragenococcus halophilus TaxID=51669 RepID=UPI0023EA00A1|nr:amidohydrolase [Tetragenococcus halophilus]GMA09377.1 aminobenzoyl-glutamate utilization protein B [Tetragenococcus halophilus subsp. flandriensis]
MKDAKQEISELIEAKKELFTDAADEIWGTPETRFAVEKSVQPYYRILEKEGFSLEKGVAHMQHSFVTTYGSGKPVIGILAEYDALANLSQVADLGEQKAEVPGGNGQGCGHNLLGTGALTAAVGIKDYMEKEKLEGTIKLFGCPAEESGYGKAFMARDGVFDDIDCALAWHPMDMNAAWATSSLAVYQCYYHFKGASAHAAAAPEQGRSALDAAELMNTGVQFLREHIIDEGRIHYAFIDAGGESANVVQPSATLYYFVRAPKIEQAKAIFDRVNKVAEGAAMMTETELETKFDSACYNYVPNQAITGAIHENLKEHGSLQLTDEDQSYAKRYYDTLTDEVKESLIERARNLAPEADEKEIQRLGTLPITEQIAPLVFSEETSGSTDVGDVSWVCPTGQVLIGCEPQGVAPHSWQWVANGKSSVAHKGLLAAGKTLATTAYDLLTQPELLEKAKEEHKKQLNGKKYQSAIPADVYPE